MELNNIPEAFTLPLRLKIIACLVNGEKNFNEIKALTDASDGNICVQMLKLETAKFIYSKKKKIGNKNLTFYSITEYGLNKLEEYVLMLEKIVKSK